MLRNLLVALDDTPAGRAAADFAVALARVHKARLQGLAVVDVAFLTPPAPGRAGALFYKERADAARLANERARDEGVAVAGGRAREGERRAPEERRVLEAERDVVERVER
ncbi:MAG: universal stress protein, partial [Tagaea sp.]